MKFLVKILILSISLKFALAGGPGGACSSTFDLNDKNGKYIKTLCSVKSPRLIQAEMSKYCKQFGMTLYNVDGKDEVEPMQKFLRDNYPQGFDYYMDTVRTGSDWDPPLNAAVKPFNDYGQSCITIGGDRPFETDSCLNVYDFICQYLKID